MRTGARGEVAGIRATDHDDDGHEETDFLFGNDVIKACGTRLPDDSFNDEGFIEGLPLDFS